MAKYPSRSAHPFPSPTSTGPTAACAAWMTLLPDAAEELLSEAEQRALDLHLAGCAACTAELAEARMGLAWLDVLRDRTPEPPQNLLAAILAQTTGLAEVGVSLPELPLLLSPADLPSAAQSSSNTLSLSQGLLRWLRGDPQTWATLLQPRLAMTAAMAFFSICLTLNLLGVSRTQVPARSLRQDGRAFTTTGTALWRSWEGLRVVYRVGARVNDLRAQQRSSDSPLFPE